jgi:DNA repair protein RecO (recombination protein O)
VDDPNQPLWELLLLVLRELDVNAHALLRNESMFDPALLLRWFEQHLLSVTGFQPQLFYCLESGEELKPETNYLSLLEGGVLSPRFRDRPDVEPIEPDVLKVLRFLQRNPWSGVRGLSVRPATMRRVENILYRMILTVLERQLKSVDVLRKLKA